MKDEVETVDPEKLKELGNLAIKNEQFNSAACFYTKAIELDPNNCTLYSNRSLAFLKLKEYYNAYEDANEAIKLNPDWVKGYFRKAEVEFATGHYSEAYNSYKEALKLKPDEISLVDSMNKAVRELLRDHEADKKIPWLGAGIGIVIGVLIVIADCVFTYRPTHPILMAFVTIMVALFGYGIARCYRYYVKYQRDGLLEPPVDLDNSREQKEEESKESRKSPRYTKFQARQRYKKGKQS